MFNPSGIDSRIEWAEKRKTYVVYEPDTIDEQGAGYISPSMQPLRKGRKGTREEEP